MANPILHDFPDSFETERLLIRSPLSGDGANIRAAVLKSQGHLKQWMPWAVNVMNEEEYETFVRQSRLRFLGREELPLYLFLKGTDTIIGASGFHNINWEVPSFEIGYWCHVDHTGHGYITETVNALTTFAFDTLGAKRVEIRCDKNNVLSAAVAERAGYILEATLHNHSRHHLTQALRDTLIYAKIAP